MTANKFLLRRHGTLNSLWSNSTAVPCAVGITDSWLTGSGKLLQTHGSWHSLFSNELHELNTA